MRYAHLAAYYIQVGWLKTKWFVLGDYYSYLLVQASYLYRSSQRFKERWEIMGLDWAEAQFEREVDYYFKLAKQEPLTIRWEIFKDSLFKREPTAYYIDDNSE